MSLVFAHGSPATRLRRLVQRVPLRSVRSWLNARAGRIGDTDSCLVQLFRRPGGWAAVPAILFWAGWAWESVETYLILRALHVPLPFAEVLSFETLLTLVRSLAVFAPSGVGIQDAGYVAALKSFGVADAATVGVTFVLVKRLKELFWIVVGFGVFTLITSGAAQATPPDMEVAASAPLGLGASLPSGAAS
jgi:uncharacterized membrane protein YbhN (UPF0104 family)